MSEHDFRTFEDFWPHYVREHAKPTTRWLHFVGTAASIACVTQAVRTRKLRWLGAALVAGYGPAWFSHFFVEHNRPATFQHPLWSLIADFKMFGLMCAGKMNDEVARAVAAAEAAASKPTNGAGHDADARHDGDDPGASPPGNANLN